MASAPASNTNMDGVQCTRIPPHVCIPQGASSEFHAQTLERAVWFPVLVFIELISPTCMHDTGPVWLLLPHRTPTWMAFNALVSPHVYAYHRALQVNLMLKRWRGPCGFWCWCSLNLNPPHVCIPQGASSELDAQGLERAVRAAAEGRVLEGCSSGRGLSGKVRVCMHVCVCVCDLIAGAGGLQQWQRCDWQGKCLSM